MGFNAWKQCMVQVCKCSQYHMITMITILRSLSCDSSTLLGWCCYHRKKRWTSWNQLSCFFCHGSYSNPGSAASVDNKLQELELDKRSDKEKRVRRSNATFKALDTDKRAYSAGETQPSPAVQHRSQCSEVIDDKLKKRELDKRNDSE